MSLLLSLVLGVLLVAPIFLFLSGGWRDRKAEILGMLPDHALNLYFQLFFHAKQAIAGGQSDAFERQYDRRFGYRRYAAPILILVLVAGVALHLACESVVAWLEGGETAGPLPAIAVGALAGGYVWVLSDLLDRWRHRDLAPMDILWGALRFVLAVPLAYALAPLANPDFAFGIAVLMGAFPTRTLFTLSRRVTRQQLQLQGADGSDESELQKLAGVDRRVAERFADEGVVTLVQLAYSDPVDLTMRCSSYDFSFVTDLASQALARTYLGDAIADLGPYSLRGAHEIGTLIEELDGSHQKQSDDARATIDAVAQKLAIDAVVLERTLREIAEDPYTNFVREVW